MKLIKITPMCGGHDKAFHVQIERRAHIIDHFYFCTTEGISTHRSEEHMNECLNGQGFVGFLDIKAQAIPIAKRLLELDLKDYDKSYLENLVKIWEK